MTLLLYVIGVFIYLRVRRKTPSCNISSTIRQPSNASITAKNLNIFWRGGVAHVVCVVCVGCVSPI